MKAQVAKNARSRMRAELARNAARGSPFCKCRASVKAGKGD
jgi:hypothetical protein